MALTSDAVTCGGRADIVWNMRDGDDDVNTRGRTMLATVTLLVVLLQLLKLGSRGLFLHQWPTLAQWGQVGFVAWLVVELWEGKGWARVVSAIYYGAATVVGIAIVALMWPKLGAPLRVVTIATVILAAWTSIILGLSASLRAYMFQRAATAAESTS